jgi:hypothetical protein
LPERRLTCARIDAACPYTSQHHRSHHTQKHARLSHATYRRPFSPSGRPVIV